MHNQPFTPAGTLVPLDDTSLLAAAQTYGVTPYFHISTLDADGVFAVTLQQAQAGAAFGFRRAHGGAHRLRSGGEDAGEPDGADTRT